MSRFCFHTCKTFYHAHLWILKRLEVQIYSDFTESVSTISGPHPVFTILVTELIGMSVSAMGMKNVGKKMKEFCFPSTTSCIHGQQLTSRLTHWILLRGNYQGSWRAPGLQPSQAETTGLDSNPQRQVRTALTHALYSYITGWLVDRVDAVFLLIFVVGKSLARCWDLWL